MTDAEKTEYEDMVRLLTTKCEELAAENARLRSSENTAHSVLREVYNDPSASPHVRVLAAKAAISHESAPLKPVAQLELKAEPAPIPLAELVRAQRARAKALESPQHPGGILPPDHPDVAKWVWNDRESMLETVRRLTGQDISDSNTEG
jgi:hypothetical protein